GPEVLPATGLWPRLSSNLTRECAVYSYRSDYLENNWERCYVCAENNNNNNNNSNTNGGGGEENPPTQALQLGFELALKERDAVLRDNARAQEERDQALRELDALRAEMGRGGQ
ncbi:hypothetical protein RRG08_043968, partial [Elysia crispata]